MDELGLMAKDKVRFWRLNNIVSMLKKAEGKMEFANDQLHLGANPRVALAIIDNASVADIDEVQELWAGLFAAACSTNKPDDGDLIFVNLLNQLTGTQARIHKFSCETAPKLLYSNGLVAGGTISLSCNELMKITGIDDIHRLDRELDHMREMGLSSSGFNISGSEPIAELSPTALALGLYVRTMGSNQTVVDYWQNELVKAENHPQRGGFLRV